MQSSHTALSAPVRARPSASAYLEEKRVRVDSYLERLLAERYPLTDDATKELSASISYSLMNGGKRLRPILTLALCERYGRDDDEALAAACASELVHTASIMLDDLPSMDDATQRRGKPANHLVYGESTTILAAMALWSEAVRLLVSIPGAEMRDIVQDAAESTGGRGLVRGQFLDLDPLHEPQTVEQLEECYRLKTGVLFEHAMSVGALLGRAPQTEFEALKSVGRTIGLIFQIRDDILDVDSTQEQIGKDTGMDARNGRTTYVSLLGVGGAKQVLRAKIAETCATIERLFSSDDILIAIVQGLSVE